jgi:hypothetical protein
MQHISCSSDSSLKRGGGKHQVRGGISYIVRFMLIIERRSKIKGKDVKTNNNNKKIVDNSLENKGTHCFQMLLRNLNLLFAKLQWKWKYYYLLVLVFSQKV